MRKINLNFFTYIVWISHINSHVKFHMLVDYSMYIFLVA